MIQKIEIIDKNFDYDLRTVIKALEWFVKRKFEVYLEGIGDGNIKIVMIKNEK